MISGDTGVGSPTTVSDAADETSDTTYNINQNYDSLKKLKILLAVDVLTKSGVPATTDSIEFMTHIHRKRVVDLIRRYSVKYKLLTKTPRTDEDTKLRGYFIYTLTRKGRYALNDMIVRFNENRNLRKRRYDHVEDHRDIVLLPGMTETFMSVLSGEPSEEAEEEQAEESERKTKVTKNGQSQLKRSH